MKLSEKGRDRELSTKKKERDKAQGKLKRRKKVTVLRI
jgi:hypothetical protein